MSRLEDIQTLIFDMDGTLYEDIDVYDRYAEALADYINPRRRDAFLSDWDASKRGEGVPRIGMGYDVDRDRLFRHAAGRMTVWVDWNGTEVPASPKDHQGPLFGRGLLNLGDWWGLPNVLATHYGVPYVDRQRAFLRTREYMAREEYRLTPEPGLPEILEALRRAGKRLIAMSNSPGPSVDDVMARLGVRGYFDEVIADAHKPEGLERYLEGAARPDLYLSLGDNFVNEIYPALVAGAYALYIDRHHTGLGQDTPHCFHIDSIAAVPSWLWAHVIGEPDAGGRKTP